MTAKLREPTSDTRLTSRRRGHAGWLIGGILVLVLIGVFVLPLVLFSGFARGFMVSGPYYSGPFFFFPFGFLIFVLVAFFAVRMVFWGWGWRRGYYYHGSRWGYGGDAKEILRLRYARGEITKEQFDQMKKDLDEQQ